MHDENAVWEKAHRKLNREVRRAHKKVRKRTAHLEQAVVDRGGTEEAGMWALGEADRIERKTFRKRRKALRKLARREKRAFDALNDAEQEKAQTFAVFALED